MYRMKLPTIPEGCEFCPPGDMKSKGARVTKKLRKFLSRKADKQVVKGLTKEVLDKAIKRELSYKSSPSKASQALNWIGTKINRRSKIVPIVAVWDENDWDREAEGNLDNCSCAGPLLCNPETSTGDKHRRSTKTRMAVKGRKIKYAVTNGPVRLAKVCARKVRQRSWEGDFFSDIQNKDRFYEVLGA
ncbi:hypothetical protein BSKO_11563 [Bryopsis sp. KO-2023]|nr:hypothetical protein BSKO_11563 [Bryopsis sp. KO-2023]